MQEAKELSWNSERILGLKMLLKEMDTYFKIFEDIRDFEVKKEFTNVTLFESVKLKNGQIVRASNSFYNEPFFSDISIQMA